MIEFKTDKGTVDKFHFSGPQDDVTSDMMLAINLLYNGMMKMSPRLAADFRRNITEAASCGILWTKMPVDGRGSLIEVGVRMEKGKGEGR